ncbi:MAG: hypothetical protein QM727_04900 [Niabella sp.]
MKTIYKQIIFLGSLSLFVLLFKACTPDKGGTLGIKAKADFNIINKDGNNLILANNSSSPSIPYWTIVETGAKFSGDSAKVYLGFAGTYHIKQTITSKGGIDEATKEVTIASTDPKVCADGTVQGFLSGCSEKTWRLLQAAGALGVGPSEADPASWWASNADDVTTGRPCAFNDKYTFALDSRGTFKYDNGGDYWSDAIGTANNSCQSNSTLSGDQAAWGSNDTDFAYMLLPGDANHPLGYLRVTGRGAHIGLEKVQNTAQSATPATSVTYNIADTATVNGHQRLTLTIMSKNSPSDAGEVWWRFILSTN